MLSLNKQFSGTNIEQGEVLTYVWMFKTSTQKKEVRMMSKVTIGLLTTLMLCMLIVGNLSAQAPDTVTIKQINWVPDPSTDLYWEIPWWLRGW